MRNGYRVQAVIGLVLVAVLLAGCQLTESAFARSASNAGAAFAAAEQTLRDVHDGRITIAYATSSFVNFRSELQGLDARLPSQSGAPSGSQIKHLLALYDTAMAAVAHPCLTDSCDWNGQLATLDAASKAFLKAGSS